MKKFFAILGGILLGIVVLVWSLSAPRSGIGVADLDSLDLSAEVSQSISFSLGSTGLWIASLFVKEDLQPFPVSALLAELDGVRVRHFEISGDIGAVARELQQLSDELVRQRWELVVRVSDDDQLAYVLTRAAEEKIQGLMVLAVEDREAVLVNVIGELDPEALGDILSGVDFQAMDPAARSG